MFEKNLPDVRINLFGRNRMAAFSLYRHAFHGRDIEAGLGKISDEQIGDVASQEGNPDKSLDAHRSKRRGLRHRGGQDRNVILLLPLSDDFLLSLVTPQEKRRRAFGMDEITSLFCQLRDSGVID